MALDWAISCPEVNVTYLPYQTPAHLDRCVLEVKGRGQHLIRALEPIDGLLYKGSFSKYAACLESLRQPEGVRT